MLVHHSSNCHQQLQQLTGHNDTHAPCLAGLTLSTHEYQIAYLLQRAGYQYFFLLWKRE